MRRTCYGVTPDLSTFGKAIGNGFSLSALAGRREIMELGGLDHDRERVFLLSTTHGAETPALAAAIATMAIVPRRARDRDASRARASGCAPASRRSPGAHGVQDHFTVVGPRLHPVLRHARRGAAAVAGVPHALPAGDDPRGVLAPSFVVSYSHDEADIDRTIEIVDEALVVYAAALEDGVERFLRGRPVQPVYRRFN